MTDETRDKIRQSMIRSWASRPKVTRKPNKWPIDTITLCNGFEFVRGLLVHDSESFRPWDTLTVQQVALIRGMNESAVRNALKAKRITGRRVQREGQYHSLRKWVVYAADAVTLIPVQRPKTSEETKQKISKSMKERNK